MCADEQYIKKRNHYRAEIDRVDAELSKLLNERAGYAIAIGKVKKLCGAKVFDPAREQEIIKRLTEMNTGPLSDEALIRIFERIIDESRRVERVEAAENQ